VDARRAGRPVHRHVAPVRPHPRGAAGVAATRRPGGVVLCHDVELTIGQMIAYGEPGAANDADGPERPVAAALDVYCKETGLSWTRQARPGSPPNPDRTFFGLGTIEIPA